MQIILAQMLAATDLQNIQRPLFFLFVLFNTPFKDLSSRFCPWSKSVDNLLR